MRPRGVRPAAAVLLLAFVGTLLVQTGAHAGDADQWVAGAEMARRESLAVLAREIDPATFTEFGKPAHAKLETRLSRLADEAAAGNQTPADIAANAAGLLTRGSAVAVTVRHDGDGVVLRSWLAAQGALVANVGAGVIEAYVPVERLAELSEQPGVLAVRSLSRPSAMITSQGAEIHGAPEWHVAGYTGAGVKVGVIDVGFRGYTSLIGSELPMPAGTRCYSRPGEFEPGMEECDDGSRHGTAVAEAVVDVAPGATIYLGVPFSSLDMLDIVQWMISEGVSIINHSAGWWWDGPGDGSSPFADSPLAAVDLAVAAGITWVNASGNNALSNWYGAYSDTNGNQLHEFSPGLDANGLVASENNAVTVEVRWDGSWNGASSDLDLFVTDSAGNVVEASIDPQQGQPGQAPFELVQFLAPESDSYQIVVSHVSGAQPAWLQVQAFSQQPLVISNATSSVTSPAESANPGMLAVGAAPWSNPATIENFSGQGPTVDGRIKPEIVGIDKGASATYGAGGFLGTSQASPHVAGMAALVKQRFPSYTPIQVVDYLKQNATPVGGQPNNIWGWGLAHLPAITGVDPIDGAAFDAVWAVTDAEVLAGGASYSWFWGPMEHDERWEPYVDSPGGQRAVRYYDKSRMEITNPAGDPNSIWYVTNGLLTTELVTGRVQLGNGTHEQHAPSEQLVAGDPSNNPGTPSYATFGQYVTPDGVTNRAPDRTGQAVTGFLTGDGQFLNIENMGYNYASYQPVTGHNIPDVFYDWMTDPTNGFRPSEGVDWLYVLGYPISEPYWIHATIGGNEQRILVQLYERRVLTYTPSNPAQYQVEFGNIGQHYHRWRYDE